MDPNLFFLIVILTYVFYVFVGFDRKIFQMIAEFLKGTSINHDF